MSTTKTIVLVGLVAVGAVVVFKHIRGGSVDLSLQLETKGAPAGVPVYHSTAAPQRVQQVYAAQPIAPGQSSQPGFSPAFGADENQVQSNEVAY